MSSERIVLFDGNCNLCNSSVDFLLRHDRAGRLRFAPLQSEIARALLARVSVEAMDQTNGDPSAIAFLDGDRIHFKSSAALRLFRVLGWPWRFFAIFLLVPKPLRDLVYDWIARNRFRWFGRRETCRLPSPEERSRFLA